MNNKGLEEIEKLSFFHNSQFPVVEVYFRVGSYTKSHAIFR